MSNMRLKNHTSIPTEKIREMIAFARPSGISNFDVRISNSKCRWRARAYGHGSAYHDTADPFVVIRIGEEGKHAYPYLSKQQGGYLSSLLLSREEALLHLIAHELRHIWQIDHTKGKVWGARGRMSERDCDAFAIRKVREWRKQNRREAFEVGQVMA